MMSRRERRAMIYYVIPQELGDEYFETFKERFQDVAGGEADSVPCGIAAAVRTVRSRNSNPRCRSDWTYTTIPASLRMGCSRLRSCLRLRPARALIASL